MRRAGSRGFVALIEAVDEGGASEVRRARKQGTLAGVDIFTLARRMGTSVKMIDRTYGHLVAGADVYERELLDAFDEAQARPVGRAVDAQEAAHAA